VSTDAPDYLFDKYLVLKNEQQLKTFMKQQGNAFVLGVGNPLVRGKMAALLTAAGGIIQSIISPYAVIGVLENNIGNGCNIMTGTVITSEVQLGEAVLINLNCTIGHNVRIGRYTELSPGVHLSGNTTVGEFSVLGTGTVVIPNVKIGNNVVVAAGSVVTKDVPDNVMLAGVPAIIKKDLPASR
jgi:sugar O-acyltransferase (sialic acid O-acetyltransferase NeuD family)